MATYFGIISPYFNQTFFFFNLTKPYCQLWFGAYLKLYFYRNLWGLLAVTLSLILTRIFQNHLSLLVPEYPRGTWPCLADPCLCAGTDSPWPLSAALCLLSSTTLNCPYSRSVCQVSSSVAVCLNTTSDLSLHKPYSCLCSAEQLISTGHQ